MPRLFKSLFLKPRDIGIQKYSENDVAKRMASLSSTENTKSPEDDSLKEFAVLVTEVFDASETQNRPQMVVIGSNKNS